MIKDHEAILASLPSTIEELEDSGVQIFYSYFSHADCIFLHVRKDGDDLYKGSINYWQDYAKILAGLFGED